MSADSTSPVDTLTLNDAVEQAQFSQRVPISSIVGRHDGAAGLVGKVVKIGGWVKTGREQGKGSFAFLEVSDGSCPANLQISAVARIRNALAYATHTFFQKNVFLYIHTPIITTSDCEGAGEMFQVTTLISEAEKLEKVLKENPAPSESDIKAAEQLVKEKGETVAQLKANKAS